MEENIENLDSPNQEEIVAPEENEPIEVGLPADPIEVEPKDEETEDSEALKQRNQELYEQLKKAKGFIRDKSGKWVKKETLKVVEKESTLPNDITRTELYSLVKANVPDEDTQEVLTYARSHGLDCTQALKTPELKAVLKVRQEYRTTAEAANTGSSRRGSSKVSDETLLANADKGIMPITDEEMQRLIKAKHGIKD